MPVLLRLACSLFLLSVSITLTGQQLPANPDPVKCYIRVVTPDTYDVYLDSVLTYTEEDAMLYAHEEQEYVLEPEMSRWESTYLKDCESDDPNDCQVLCYKTYPAEVITFLVPKDTSLGNPYWDVFQMKQLVSKGGLSSYEEIDCSLTSYNVLPIQFATGSAALGPDFHNVVDDRLLDLLEKRENLRIQINAHTDSRGSAAANQSLSERRAKSVADYLVSRGINRERLTTRGYGESQLKNRCADGANCSEEEHAVNERVEFRVLEVGIGSPDFSRSSKRTKARKKRRNRKSQKQR